MLIIAVSFFLFLLTGVLMMLQSLKTCIQLYPLFLFFKLQSTFSSIFFISFFSFLEWVVCGMSNQESPVNKKSRFTRKTYSNHASRKNNAGTFLRKRENTYSYVVNGQQQTKSAIKKGAFCLSRILLSKI